MLCVQCMTRGHCRRLQVRLVTDAELANPEFIRDLRRHAHAFKFGRDAWLENLSSFYRDYPGSITDETFLKTTS